MAKSNIYTATGDTGTTSLVGGLRVDKDDMRLNAYGTVDELNSFIGALVAQINADTDTPASDISMGFVTNARVETATLGAVLNEDLTLLQYVQNQLFVIGSYLATDPSFTEFREASMLSGEAINKLERRIDVVDAALPKHNQFIRPGGCQSAASANVARAVCRRTERELVSLSKNIEVDPLILKFINRLSDYLFILSRACNVAASEDEVFWDKSCK